MSGFDLGFPGLRMFARSTWVTMLLPNREKWGHKVFSAIARALKRGLSHLLVALQKGPVGAIVVVALHVPNAGRSAVGVPFMLLSVSMPAGPQPWVWHSLEKAHPWL